MKRLFSFSLLCALTLLASLTAKAQTGRPVFHKSTYTDNSIVWNVSDNGKWAVLMGATGEQQQNSRAKLVSVSNINSPLYLSTSNGGSTATDVTDDGNIVVGSYSGTPAYYNKSTSKWTKLPLPSGYTSGEVLKVTPDGKYAVGTVYVGSYGMGGGMWDLTTGKLIELTNLPTTLESDENALQLEFKDISADGRYIAMVADYSYTWKTATYLYDVQEQSLVRPGFTKNADGSYATAIDGLLQVEEPVLSNNGKYFAAFARMDAGGYDEYVTTILYNTETKTTEVYTDNTSHDMIPARVDNEGHVFGANPSTTPVREWSVRVGKFWYPFSQILSQVYGMNFTTITNYDNTGTPYSISDDGKVLSSMIDSNGGGTYIVEMPQDFGSICAGIDLLGGYSATPASGSTVSKIGNITLVFEREVKVLGDKTAAKIYDENGKQIYQSAGFKVNDNNDKTVNITFRPRTITEGKTWTVVIPAGAIALAEDETQVNKAITLSYNGRGTDAVKVKNIYPADHSQIAKIDNNSNPVYLTFDAKVQATDSAKAQLIRVADGVKIADLSVMAQDTMAALYPSATQYLYEGQEYKVVLAKGSITDLSGNGANDELTINYHGTYIREITEKNDTVFFDGFSNISNSLATWMRYEGDHNTPVSTMTSWEFDTDNQPWNFSIRESSTSKDYCAASHSMYDPAGRSDDWMVIPQIYVSDANYYLAFDAQSYKKAKKDSLKVLVWTCDENFNEMTATTIARIKAEGDLVVDTLLTPGLTEEDLTDDWENIRVDLAPYAGKNIYIAFWNNNEDQSVVFVDNVLVKHEVKFTLALNNAESVVAKESTDIKGRLTIKSKTDTYTKAVLTLCDANGNAVSTYTQSGTELKENSTVDFTFDKPLPLTIGETNSFTVKVQLDEYTSEVKSSVKDLTFQPERYVVLEEFTGTTCVNCPLGILAIDRLKGIYGHKFIPVSIHTYGGDPLASGQGGYSSALNLAAAPSGIVDREGTIISPMTQNPRTADYVFNYNGTLWADHVAAEFDTPTELELTLGDLVVDSTTLQFTIPMQLRSALNAKNQSVNVFVVVLEDSIVNSQTNTFYNISDANLGEWGKGGIYGNAENYNIIHNDVARASYGTSYNGTAGFFPQSFTAGETYTNSVTVGLPENVNELANCKTVVMLIDGNTDKVINANVAFFDKTRQTNGIEAIKSQTATGQTEYFDLQGRRIAQPTHGLYIVKTAGKTTKVFKK